MVAKLLFESRSKTFESFQIPLLLKDKCILMQNMAYSFSNDCICLSRLTINNFDKADLSLSWKIGRLAPRFVVRYYHNGAILLPLMKGSGILHKQDCFENYTRSWLFQNLGKEKLGWSGTMFQSSPDSHSSRVPMAISCCENAIYI